MEKDLGAEPTSNKQAFPFHDPERLPGRLVLVAGPPRSGTTFAAKTLGAHPAMRAMIDDHVWERWVLYYYVNRTGLIADLRAGKVGPAEIRARLAADLVREGHLHGVGPSPATADFPLSSPPRRPDGASLPRDLRLVRRDVPLAALPPGVRLVLKSPELSFVLPPLAQALPAARWVLLWRPLAEIAESMHRKGHTVAQPVFHRRWELERDGAGRPLPPPGILARWTDRWRSGRPADWCALAAASALIALADGVAQLPPGSWVLYDHAALRRRPEPVLDSLAAFLGVTREGLASVDRSLEPGVPETPPEVAVACQAVAALPETAEALDRLERISGNGLGGAR